MRIEAPIALSGPRLLLPCPAEHQVECGGTFIAYPLPTTDPRGQSSATPSVIAALNPGQDSERVTLTFFVDRYIFPNGQDPFWGTVSLTANYTLANVFREEHPAANVNLRGTGADLFVQITPTGETAAGRPADAIDVRVANVGPADATDVTLSIQLPSGFTPRDFVPNSQCGITPGNRIVCNLSLRHAEVVSFTISLTPVQVGSSAFVWGSISSATLSDPNLEDNQAVVSLLGGPLASLVVDGVSASREANPPQRSTTFVFRVFNDGITVAHNLNVRAAGDGATITQICVASCAGWDGSLRALNINLLPGESALIRVIATVNRNATGRVALAAGVTDPEGTGYFNNRDQLTVFPAR
jgi:hypothetical protein